MSPPSIDVEVFEVLGQGHAVTIQFFHFFARLDVKIPHVTAWMNHADLPLNTYMKYLWNKTKQNKTTRQDSKT